MDAADPTAESDHELYQALQRAWTKHKDNNDGTVADYIPELSKANPDAFGLAIATTKGEIYAVGDAEVPFTIQSVSKAFAFCLALEIAGSKRVMGRVGVEPSGDPFNAILFDPETSRPFNPMVNAGAIAISGMLCEYFGKDALDFMLHRFSIAAGRKLSVDEQVYQSELRTGHRNRAIAHLLLANGALSVSPDTALDLYFKQCSISVTAVDLARMGATLANMGQHPLEKSIAFELTSVRRTLSVMFTCGMYDYAGHWAFDVGVPAKSGVAGGIVGVINRQIGIGTYAPRLDKKGNSVRGIATFETLVEEFGLHAFDCTNVGSTFISSLIR